MRVLLGAWLLLVAGGAAAPQGGGDDAASAAGAGRETMGSPSDFDFLAGRRWRVRNRVLAERLAGSRTWNEFDAELTDFRHILAGHGNVDRFRATRDGQPFEASSIRVFDPGSAEWHIYWADTSTWRVLPQVVGRFDGDHGEFFGEDVFRGRPVKLRFVWRDVRSGRPRWEQAYQDPDTGEWETNWFMVFEPLDE